MKVKSAHATAGIGKLHGYLGHFAKPKHINRGHNDLKNDYEVLNQMQRDRSEGGLPSDQERQRLARERAQGARQEAEAKAANARVLDNISVDAPASRDSAMARDPKSRNLIKRGLM